MTRMNNAKIDAYAKQAGLTVLPRLGTRAKIRSIPATAGSRLRQSKLFVQLLSDLPGKKPPGWPSRLPVVQYEQAKRVGLPILQWRSKELDLEELKATRCEHHNLVTAPRYVPAASRNSSGQWSRRPHAPPSPPRLPKGKGEVMVFVDSDSSDRRSRQRCAGCSAEEGVGYSLPVMTENLKPPKSGKI